MATDVEESDTDEHECPVPPKRQRTGRDDGGSDEDHLPSPANRAAEPDEEREERERQEPEKLSREKLNVWQSREVVNGFLDNTINCIVEDYRLRPSRDHSRADDVEDTAVGAAILDRGLVRAVVRRSSSSEGSPSSSAVLAPSTRSPEPRAIRWSEDRMDESDREQDFLERAVAEAIKKKGLSALSVDYG